MESEHNLTWVQSIQQHYYGSRYFLNDFLSQFECCSCETITQLVYYQLQQQQKNANDKNEALKITKFSVSRVVIVSWFPLLLSYIICAIDEKPYQLQKMKRLFCFFFFKYFIIMHLPPKSLTYASHTNSIYFLQSIWRCVVRLFKWHQLLISIKVIYNLMVKY